MGTDLRWIGLSRSSEEFTQVVDVDVHDEVLKVVKEREEARAGAMEI